MHKCRETMPDGRRYMVFYTFGDNQSEDFNRQNTETLEEENEKQESDGE